MNSLVSTINISCHLNWKGFRCGVLKSFCFRWRRGEQRGRCQRRTICPLPIHPNLPAPQNRGSYVSDSQITYAHLRNPLTCSMHTQWNNCKTLSVSIYYVNNMMITREQTYSTVVTSHPSCFLFNQGRVHCWKPASKQLPHDREALLSWTPTEELRLWLWLLYPKQPKYLWAHIWVPPAVWESGWVTFH